MATPRQNADLYDIQNDDTEIDLQFQDFGSTSAPSHPNDDFKGQTVYFNSFPDSAVDDQEQKLLSGDEDTEETDSRGVSSSFWTLEFYQQFFDVDTGQVLDRIRWSMIPKPGTNYLQSYIRPKPDLYGPFWICVTLVFTTALSGNLSSYLQFTGQQPWRYDFHKVTLATTSIFCYAWLVPLLIYAILFWRGSGARISVLELVCLYGYSLAIFVPVSLLWLIPVRWLQWCVGFVGAVLSGSVIVRTVTPAVGHDAKRAAAAVAALIMLLHAALALGFMLYFFYPPVTPKFETGNAVTLLPTVNIPKNISMVTSKKDSMTKRANEDKIENNLLKLPPSVENHVDVPHKDDHSATNESTKTKEVENFTQNDLSMTTSKLKPLINIQSKNETKTS